MTYYDPELANWLKGTPAAKTLAKDSIVLAEAFGNPLSGVYTAFGAKVADVFKTFHTTQFAARVTLPASGTVPKDVGYICSYTWMCAAPRSARTSSQPARLRRHRQHLPGRHLQLSRQDAA